MKVLFRTFNNNIIVHEDVYVNTHTGETNIEKYLPLEITKPYLDLYFNEHPLITANETSLYRVTPTMRIERHLIDPIDFSDLIIVELRWHFMHKEWCKKFCTGAWYINRNTICFEHIEDHDIFVALTELRFLEQKWKQNDDNKL